MKKILLIVSATFALTSWSFASIDVEKMETTSAEELSVSSELLDNALGDVGDHVARLSSHLENFSERLSNPVDIISPRKQMILKKYEYDNMFGFLKKYIPKVKRYLDEVSFDMDAYVEQYGIGSDSHRTVLEMAIENVVYGDNREFKIKRDQLKELLFDYLF